MSDAVRAYRILLSGGPCDGQSLIARNPWIQCGASAESVANGLPDENSKKWLYEAERDESGQPLMEDGDQGNGNIQVLMCDTGDSFNPPVSTIRMTFSGREWEPKDDR